MLNYFFKLKFYLGLRSAIKVYLDKVIFKRKITIEFLKHKIMIRHDDIADNQTFNDQVLKGTYRGLLDNPHNVQRIIDLGSNIGLSVVLFLCDYPNVEIVAVEPEQRNLDVLKENIKPYLAEGRKVILYEAPVYSREMELTLYDPNTGSHGFRVTSDEHIGNSIGKVDAVTLNGILKNMEWDSVDMIKIDIEGAEFELLSENTEWLGKTKYLVIETHDRFKENCTKQLFKALEPYKYKMSIVNQSIFINFVQS
jgi:FkbM family methyltransferase